MTPLGLLCCSTFCCFVILKKNTSFYLKYSNTEYPQKRVVFHMGGAWIYPFVLHIGWLAHKTLRLFILRLPRETQKKGCFSPKKGCFSWITQICVFQTNQQFLLKSFRFVFSILSPHRTTPIFELQERFELSYLGLQSRT